MTADPFMQRALRVRTDKIPQLLNAGDVGVCSPFRDFVAVGPAAETAGTQMSRSAHPMIRKLARPRARLRLTTIFPGPRALVLDFFMTEDTAHAVYLKEGALHIGAGLPITELAGAIAEHLIVDTSRPAKAQTYGAVNIRLATALWCGTGIKPSGRIEKERALEILGQPNLYGYRGLDRVAACDALRRAVKSGCLREVKRRLELQSDFGSWMELLWSGHFLELQYGYARKGRERQTEHAVRMIFAGPVTNRFLMRAAPVNIAAPDQSHSAGGQAVRFAQFSRAEARQSMRALLCPR